MINKLYILILISLVTACASTPEFDTSNVDNTLTPQRIVSEPELAGKTALWGGTILSTQNLEDSTELEILAYPLNTYYRPLLDSPPQGRFIIIYKGYLEPATYTEGRNVTVIGKVAGTRKGNVGETTYTYAVINSEQLHLWSLDSGRNRTNFHLGIGIQL